MVLTVGMPADLVCPARRDGRHQDAPKHCRACDHHHCGRCGQCVRCERAGRGDAIVSSQRATCAARETDDEA